MFLRLTQIVLFLGLFAGDKTLRRCPFGALAAGIEKAGDREHHRADEVHKQVLHGVNDANVQIAAKAQTLTVNDHILDIWDGYNLVGAGDIQCGAVDGVNHCIPLHVCAQKEIHAEFKKFPQHADGHGETNGHQSQKQRGEIEG